MDKVLKDKSVSIIIPTYNERENITPLVERIHHSLQGYDYQIIFIDDNSEDGTAEIAYTLSQKYPVKVVVRKNERGLSSAVMHGIKLVNSEFVAVMDADLQHPPEVLQEILKELKTHDLVVASRYCKGGSPGHWTISRRIVSTVANLLALPLVPKVKDRMSGFFGFRLSIIEKAPLNTLGWKIGLEIMARGSYNSATEVPYTFLSRTHGESKLSRRIIWQYLQQLLRLYMQKYKILNFMVVGGIGYVINMLVLSALIYWPPAPIFKLETSFLGQHFYLLPFIISSLIAIASNYLLNKIWTFKGWSEQRLGGLRYLSMALVTLLGDMVFMLVLVDYLKMPYVPAAALAILIVFIARYIIAKHWVWVEKPKKSS